MDNNGNTKNLEQKIRQLENEIKLLTEEKEEEAARFYSLYNEMESEVRRRSSLIQEQNFKLAQEIEKRKKAEQDLRKSIVEKDFLFKELHHRVKNNLQLITSIMNLQIKSSDNEEFKQALAESQQKVKSMALVHDFIYDSGSSDRINLSEYLTFLTMEIFKSTVRHFSLRKLDLNIAPGIIAPLKVSLPCGLIINELITNSVKYAFEPSQHGIVSVKLEEKEGNFHLTISDNGNGIHDDNIFNKAHCLGLNLVKLLVENQLRGKIDYSNSAGSKFDIIIPNRLK